MKRKTNNQLIKLIAGLLIIIVIGAAGWLMNKKKTASNSPDISTPTTQQNSESAQNDIISYNGKDGIDALTILKENHTVESSTSEYGAFVNSIDGKAADSNTTFWAFYINGAMANQAADKTITKNTDKIEWKLTPITAY